MAITLNTSKVVRLDMATIDGILNFTSGATAGYVNTIGGIKVVEGSIPHTAARKVLDFHYGNQANLKTLPKPEKNVRYGTDRANLAEGFRLEAVRRQEEAQRLEREAEAAKAAQAEASNTSTEGGEG